MTISEVPPTNTFFQTVLAICRLASGSLSKTVADWLFDNRVSVTCISIKQFQQIPIDQKPEKLPYITKLVDARGND